MNITVMTLGNSWLIVPELIGFIAPQLFDFYRFHPQSSEIIALKERYNIKRPDELWIITTSTELKSIDNTITWLNSLNAKLRNQGLKYKIITIKGIKDIFTQQECLLMRDSILRVAFNARNKTELTGQLLLSLVGGRKMMSSDLQYAASFFGCDALIHIADKIYELQNQERSLLDSINPKDFLLPPGKNISSAFMPIVIGHYPASPLLSLIDSQDYTLPEPLTNIQLIEPDTKLVTTLESMVKEAESISYNLKDPNTEKESANYAKIITLNPLIINRIRNIHFGVFPEKSKLELGFLQKLPKAELHCHLGGVLSPKEMIEASFLHEKEIEEYKRKSKSFKDDLVEIKKYIDRKNIDRLNNFIRRRYGTLKDIRSAYKDVPEPFSICGFLYQFNEDNSILEKIIYDKYLDPNHFRAICRETNGFNLTPYEKLGDLQGSSLLRTEKLIKYAVKTIAEKCIKDNVRYLELRCSPLKYESDYCNARDVFNYIKEELSKYKDKLVSRILIITSRHSSMSEIYKNLEFINDLEKSGLSGGMIAGVDLAGNEISKSPKELREPFLSIMNQCVAITIHAGETVDAENIWEAVYHLSAERIGHGLTLIKNKNLMNKFLNRGIALEMCPSSNFQVIGYQDYALPEIIEDEYPLKSYLDNSLKVTINTDNPGISKTTLSQEYLKASRMIKGGLSLMDLLQINKNGFTSAFLEHTQRRRLILSVEEEILKLLKEKSLETLEGGV